MSLGDRDHPYVVFHFTENRSGDGPQEMFAGYQGYLQAALSTRILGLFYKAVSREVFVLSVVDGLLVGRLLRPALISE